MKLHHTTPLLVSFKSILQHRTRSPGDAEPVQGKSLLGSVCCGGTVQDLWGEQMHPAGSAGFRHLSVFPSTHPKPGVSEATHEPGACR